MNKNYKAVPYNVTIHHEAIVDKNEPWNDTPAYDTHETRFRIVSTDTGEILDDAQGYGYRTAQKAYSAYAYKTRDKSKDKEKGKKEAEIKKWMKEHKGFVNLMDEIAFEILKGSWGTDEKFDTKFLTEMLKENNLEVNFKPSELLNVWRKGK